MRSKLAIIIVMLNLLSSTALAMWARIPLEELVQRADAGIIAKLTDVQKTAGWGVVHGTGMLGVDEVLFGDALRGDRIPIKWTIYAGVIPSGDLSYFDSQRIWLITLDDGIASAWWQDVIDPARKPEVICVLANPVRARVVKDYSVKLIYRNLTSESISVPRLAMSQGALMLPAECEINVNRRGDDLRIDPYPGKIEHTTSAQMMDLRPGQVVELRVALNDFYPMDRGEAYELSWSVNGVGKSNAAHIRPLDWETDEGAGSETPLWFNVALLFAYSPTREIFAALIVGAFGLFGLYRNRRAQQLKGLGA